MASTSNLSTGSSDEQGSLSEQLINPSIEGNRKRRNVPDSDEMNAKKPRKNLPESANPLNQCSEASLRIMKQMGYKVGTGLGKSGQGRVDLIETSSQKGRSGLGMKHAELDTAADQWDPSKEHLQVPEKVYWLKNDESESDELGITREQLDAWIKVGPRKMTINDEDKYCDREILLQILDSKSVFDNLGAEDMRKARTKSNPYELIKSNIFINRASVKMANMDSMYEFMFTKPLDAKGKPMVKENDLFYFADVCAGPGGFSEYVLWRNGWRAKGFGFTLKGANDFRLDDFSAGAPETFDPYYGPKDDGDIFDPANISGFAEYVMKQSETGVHLMMADGGFSVEGRENLQEILSKQLYLCQVIVALAIVRNNGHFVMKLFDVFTPFSVGLLYLVYKCFKQISICKPNSSRPANSERYLVCKWKKPNTDLVQRHLEDVNRQMFNNRNETIDTLELVSEEVLQGDTTFYNYIRNSNNKIGRNQITGLLKIAAFCKNRNHEEPRQLEMKQKCLKLWKLDDSIRKFSNKGDPDQYVAKFYNEWKDIAKEICVPEKKVKAELRASFPSAHDWYFVPIGIADNGQRNEKNIRTILLGKGGKEVYQFDTKQCAWLPLKDIAIELSPGTIIYAEIVKELQGEAKSQIVVNTLHIIDGLVLGGENIRRLPLSQRMAKCQQFAKALNKPIKSASTANNSTCTVTIQVRAKKLYTFFEMETFFNSLEEHKLKTGEPRLGYHVRNPVDEDRFYIPYGLLFLKEVKPAYMKTMSKTRKMFYYFHILTKQSKYPEQFANQKAETLGTFEETFHSRVLWNWEDVNQVKAANEGDRLPGKVYRVDFNAHLEANYP